MTFGLARINAVGAEAQGNSMVGREVDQTKRSAPNVNVPALRSAANHD